MRELLKFLSVCFVIVALTIVKVYSQEENQHAGGEAQELNSHPELNLNDDKTLILDQDLKSLKSFTAKEVIPSPTVNSQKAAAPNKKKEDPFSFNFLYFIIQKFKFSDIVDEEGN